jgi:hypothetical protein
MEHNLNTLYGDSSMDELTLRVMSKASTFSNKPFVFKETVV